MSDNADKYDLISELFSEYRQIMYKEALSIVKNRRCRGYAPENISKYNPTS